LVARDVVGAGVDRRHQIVLRVALGVDDGDSLLLENPRHRAGFAEVPAGAREDMADLRPGAVAVVGQRLDEDRDAARPVALVDDGLDRLRVAVRTGSLRDRALDVVLRHARVLRLLNRVRERGVAGRVPPTLARSHLDRARELREMGALTGVGDRLLVLYLRPFGMARHR